MQFVTKTLPKTFIFTNLTIRSALNNENNGLKCNVVSDI